MSKEKIFATLATVMLLTSSFGVAVAANKNNGY